MRRVCLFLALFATSMVSARALPAHAQPAHDRGPGVLVVDLGRAPANAVIVAGLPARIDLAQRVCAVSGPAWASAGPDDRSVAIARERFTPDWFEVATEDPDGGCESPVRTRFRLAAEAALAPRPATVVVQAESRVAELRAADVGGHQLLAVRDGLVRGVTACAGGETCALVVPPRFVRGVLRGDPVGLLLWPAAIPLAAGDPVPGLLDADGSWTPWSALAAAAVEVEFQRPLLRSAELNVAAEPAELPLVMPEAVAGVRCRRARCALTATSVEIYAVEPTALSVQVTLELAPGAVRRTDGRTTTRETATVPLVRCAMRAAAPVPLLAGTQNHRYFVAIARDCYDATADQLAVETRPPVHAWVKAETPAADAAWRVFEVVVGRVPEGVPSLELTLQRREPQRTNLGALRVEVADDYLPRHVRFELADLGLVDFVPSNREARVDLTYAHDRWEEDIRLEERRGYYRTRHADEGGWYARAVAGAPGAVPLRMAYAPEALAQVLGRRETLVHVDTEARYRLRQVNVPLPLVRGPGEPPPFVRVFCRTDGVDRPIPPGRSTSIPFAERDGCRLEIDRAAIPESAGEQRLRISSGKQQQIVSVSHRSGVIGISLPAGNKAEFDPLTVSVAHEYSGGHYDLSPRHNIGPEATYRVVLGDRLFRISAGTALPTGLFRFGFEGERGSLPLSAGVSARFVVLYKEGKEFPVGWELGVLGTGLSETPHLSVVTGLGFSIPVLNPNTPLQTSFNIHAWLEYSPTRTGPDADPWAFIFGPSFSVGKFSTSL